MKEAERRQTLIRILRILRCGSRLMARSFVGVPPRLSPKGIIPSQRLSFRPGFLGRGLHGRYPPSPVPVQGCTSHPGHNAGRHDAQAARERPANPPAGTALAPMTRCASAPCPSMSEDCDVTDVETYVNKKVTPSKPPLQGEQRRPPAAVFLTKNADAKHRLCALKRGRWGSGSLRCATFPLAGEDESRSPDHAALAPQGENRRCRSFLIQ